MTKPLHFHWTKKRGGTLFAATYDETEKDLPADLGEWVHLQPFAVEIAGKLGDDFPRKEPNEEIQKLGYFLFSAKVTFVDVKPR